MPPNQFSTSVPSMPTTVLNGPQMGAQKPIILDNPRPFGHALANFDEPDAQRAKMFHQENNPMRGKSMRSPIYFDPEDKLTAGGLVSGAEEPSKYAILKNLMASCLGPIDDPASAGAGRSGVPRGMLCFTAENGALNIVRSLSSLAHGPERDKWASIVILTSPRSVSNIRTACDAVNTGSLDVKVQPLVIHYEDLNLDHIRYIASKVDPINSYTHAVETGAPPEALAQNVAAGFLDTWWWSHEPARELNDFRTTFIRDHVSRSRHRDSAPPTAGYHWPPPPSWMEWTLNGQPKLPSSIQPIKKDERRQHSSQTDSSTRPVVLCVDFTGFSQESLVMQNVLADIALKGWLDYYQPTSTSSIHARNIIVCDYPELYLTEGPFGRSLLRLISTPTRATTSAVPSDPQGTNTHTNPVYTPRHANLVLLSHSPTSLPPSLLDRLSYLVIHRFTSPRQLKALQDHFPLSTLSNHYVDGNSEPFNHGSNPVNRLHSPDLMDRIMKLKENQALLFASSPTKMPFTSSARRNSGVSVHEYGVIQPPSKSDNKISRHHDLQQRLTLVRLFGDEEHEDDIEDDLQEPITLDVDLSKSTLYSTTTRDSSRGPARPGQGLTLGSLPQIDVVDAYNMSEQRPRQVVNPRTPNMSYASPYKPWGPVNLTADSPNISGSAALGGDADFFLSAGRNVGTPGAGVIGSNDYNTGTSRYATSTSLLSPTTRSARTGSPFVPGATPIHPTGMSYSPGPVSPPASGASRQNFYPFAPRGDYPLGSGPMSGKDARYNQYSNGEPPNFHAPSDGRSNNSPKSRDGSSADYVEVGNASGAESSLAKYSGSSSSFSRLTSDDASGQASNNNNPNLGAGGYGFGGLLKKSYAVATAPTNAYDAHQRHDSGSHSTNNPLNSSMESTSTASYSNKNSYGPATATSTGSRATPISPTEPPNYPESFFWPLLDALDKARQQVSTPHNRAQSVRHSVVGQELPPSARARLGLTFKEYVAAASRAGVVVTGDSGDKAWIAVKEWKYPGKGIGPGPTPSNPGPGPSSVGPGGSNGSGFGGGGGFGQGHGPSHGGPHAGGAGSGISGGFRMASK